MSITRHDVLFWTNAQVYSLIGGFCGSPVNFHSKDGSGYKFLGELVVKLDKMNPQVSYITISIAFDTIHQWITKHYLFLKEKAWIRPLMIHLGQSDLELKDGFPVVTSVCLSYSSSNGWQVASRMVSAFSRWKRYDETRQSLAKVSNCFP